MAIEELLKKVPYKIVHNLYGDMFFELHKDEKEMFIIGYWGKAGDEERNQHICLGYELEEILKDLLKKL